MLPVGICQIKACNPIGMEVVNEVVDLFAQEAQYFVLIEKNRLT